MRSVLVICVSSICDEDTLRWSGSHRTCERNIPNSGHRTREIRRFVGFYWTLQVPWTGFTKLSPNVDEAARQSRTIAYQRALAKSHVQDQKGEFVGEFAFMELSADRGTEHIAPVVEQAAALSRKTDAELLWVDFAQIGWRDHSRLRTAVARVEETGVKTLDLQPIELGGFLFRAGDDLTPPAFTADAHFTQWKSIAARWRADRDRRIVAELREALQIHPEGYGRNTRIADRLNERGVPTKTDGLNRRWSGDLVRKAIQALDDDNAVETDAEPMIVCRTV